MCRKRVTKGVPARSGRIDFAPVRRKSLWPLGRGLPASAPTGRRVFRSGIHPPRASSAPWLRNGGLSLCGLSPISQPSCASHSAITGGGKWLRRKRSRQGIRPVTPFAYALPFLCVVSRFSLAASRGLLALATRLRFRFAPSSYFRRSYSPNEPIMNVMQSFAGVESSAWCPIPRPSQHVCSLGVTPAKRYIT